MKKSDQKILPSLNSQTASDKINQSNNIESVKSAKVKNPKIQIQQNFQRNKETPTTIVPKAERVR